MKTLVFISLFLGLHMGQLAVDRQTFYQAMEASNVSLVDSQLKLLQSKADKGDSAFLGTMIMKKASLGGSPITKLKLFKQGHRMLEAAIRKDPDNAEYRFLRLMIEEHAPGVLGYNNDISKDSEYIKKTYKSLPEDVQQAIVDYSKKSKYLKLDLS